MLARGQEGASELPTVLSPVFPAQGPPQSAVLTPSQLRTPLAHGQPEAGDPLSSRDTSAPTGPALERQLHEQTRNGTRSPHWGAGHTQALSLLLGCRLAGFPGNPRVTPSNVSCPRSCRAHSLCPESLVTALDKDTPWSHPRVPIWPLPHPRSWRRAVGKCSVPRALSSPEPLCLQPALPPPPTPLLGAHPAPLHTPGPCSPPLSPHLLRHEGQALSQAVQADDGGGVMVSGRQGWAWPSVTGWGAGRATSQRAAVRFGGLRTQSWRSS